MDRNVNVNLNLALLKRLCETPGAPGHEERVREIVVSVLGPSCDEVSTDALGNVIGLRRARRVPPGQKVRKLMLSSHMDEISFLVTHVDDQGFVRFTPLGGFDPKTLTAQRVIVQGKRDLLGVVGSKPIHIMTEEERKAAPKLEDYFVDVGLPPEEVRALVSVGDAITRQRELVEVGDALSGKSFDNRMGVFVMLEAVAALDHHEVDVYAVASVQEEIGIRGATVAARNIDPDIGMALDITVANDVPEAKAHEHITRLGRGAAIKVMDSSVVCNARVVAHLKALAQEHGIPFQVEVLTRGGTDTAALQRSGKGAAVGCISIPTRYVHSVIEMCHKADIRAAIDLLRAFIESAHRESYAP
ncbi:MAG: M42 family metallopeptidase [Planctomycetes bacterium]|nr:M42 family metallopeptidase [Planctomycetota bacterium]